MKQTRIGTSLAIGGHSRGIKTIKDRTSGGDEEHAIAPRGAIEYGMAGTGYSRTTRAFTSEGTIRLVKQLATPLVARSGPVTSRPHVE